MIRLIIGIISLIAGIALTSGSRYFYWGLILFGIFYIITGINKIINDKKNNHKNISYPEKIRILFLILSIAFCILIVLFTNYIRVSIVVWIFLYITTIFLGIVSFFLNTRLLIKVSSLIIVVISLYYFFIYIIRPFILGF